jgi:PPOX class probable F420-dependent enzyme
LDSDEARRRFAGAPIARLATITPAGQPHVVPICFAVSGDVVYSAVDDKPKSSAKLQRLANVATTAAATLLVDHYDDDWTSLWWARADGLAVSLADGTDRDAAVMLLRGKYPQYRDHALDGAVLAIAISRWTGWAAGTSRAR